MRSKIILFLFIILMALHSQADPYFGGEFKYSKAWYMFPDRWQQSKDNYHLVDIYIKNEIDDKVDFKVRFQTRLWEDSNINNLLTYEFIPWEAWVKANDVFMKNLNLKVGRQYFEWGTADGIHPSSVLTPDDYTDPLAMGDKIPVDAVYINYLISEIKLDLIWLPTFTPVKFPKYFPLFDSKEFQIPGTSLGNIYDTVQKPKKLPDGMGKAAKISSTIFDIDFSIGYFHGYDYLPMIKSLHYMPANNLFTQYDLYIESFFPKMQVYTCDFTTSIAGFGFWGEAGIYDHQKVESRFIITPFVNEKETLLNGDPYISYVLGTDYNFESGFYFNFQYAYGLPYMRGEDYMEDYFILTFTKDFFYGLLEIELGNIFGFHRAYNVLNNYELMLFQEIHYNPYEDFSISLRFIEIEANGKVLFSDWEKYDTIGTYISYSF